MGGAVLSPDLRLRLTLTGSDLSHAIVVVTKPGGQEVTRVERALETDVTAFHATAARTSPAEISAKLTVKFEALRGMGPFVVSATPVDASGREGSPVSVQVPQYSPF